MRCRDRALRDPRRPRQLHHRPATHHATAAGPGCARTGVVHAHHRHRRSGPGLGLAIARTFGKEGFSVALVSRTQAKLDQLAAQLESEGITAKGFTADVLDRPSLTAALQAVKEHFGSIDVLEYSPADTAGGVFETVDVRHTTPENVQPQVEYYLYGAMTATAAVLPEMLDAVVARSSSPLVAAPSTRCRCSATSTSVEQRSGTGRSTSARPRR